MTDSDKNVRTLIICFVLALIGLVPLKIGTGGVLTGESKVLGEMKQIVVENNIEIVLPDVGGLSY
jgi:hypothetical protein